MILLAIDPGAAAKPTPKNPRPDPARHGWCLLEILLDQRPQWVSAGHDTEDTVRCHMRTAGVTTVVIERPTRVHREEVGMSLLETAFAAGWFYGVALETIGSANTLSAEHWRTAVVGLRSPSDAQVKAALVRLLDLPARSNAHERDACGVGLGWALRSGVLVGGRGRRTPSAAVAE